MPIPFDFQRLPDLPGKCCRIACPTVPYEALRLWQDEVFDLIRRAAALEGELETEALAAMENFLRFAYTLPASGSHHHDYPGGLIEHTMNVALQALLELGASSSPQMRFEALLAALLHDVGKAAHVIVEAQGRPDLIWDFEAQPLADWVEENQVETIIFSWVPGRQQVGPHSCEPLSLLLQKHIIRFSLHPLLDIAGINQLLACQIRHLSDAGCEPLLSAIRQADGTSVHSGRPVGQRFKGRFFEVLAGNLLRAGPINDPDGELFLSRTHTIVALPHDRDGQRRGTVWWQACSQLAEEFGAPTAQAITDRVLADASLGFVSRNRRSYCRKPTVFHVGCDRLMPSVIVPNSCFGDELKPLMPPPPLGKPLLIQDLESSWPRVTWDDLGFGDAWKAAGWWN